MVNGAVKANDRQATITRRLSTLIFLVASMLHCGEIRAQESAGQAEVAMQGYYMTGSNQSLTETSGMAANSTQFIKGLGMITSNIEGYGGDGFRAGNLFVGLEGTPLLGWHWDFVGGDFHFS